MGKKLTSLSGRWIAAALLIAPLGSASAQRPVRPPSDPILRPGDMLRINVWRHPEMSGDLEVGADSTLVHPVYQTIKVAGVPLPVVKERLRGLLAKYEQDVQLVIEPLFPVTVAGGGRAPHPSRPPPRGAVAKGVGAAGGRAGGGGVGEGGGGRAGGARGRELG